MQVARDLESSVGASSKRAERSLADGAPIRLPTICCVDLVTFFTAAAGRVFFTVSGGVTAMTVSGDATVWMSPCLTISSTTPLVARNQPLIRDCTGDASGLGDSEGNEVRLLVSSGGEGCLLLLRLSDALEARLLGRTRCMLRCLGLERVEFCEAVRTRSYSTAAITARL